MSDSLITKRSIAHALKSIVPLKPFEKISVADITKTCGLNRQTFYYHFQDKYDLLTWIYQEEAFSFVTCDITFDNWDQKVLLLLEIMKNDHVFYTRTIKSDSRYFMDYLLKITSSLFKDAIEALDVEHHVSENQKHFFCEFYAYGICGTILSWVQSGMKEQPCELARNFKKLAIHSEQLGYNFYIKEHTI